MAIYPGFDSVELHSVETKDPPEEGLFPPAPTIQAARASIGSRVRHQYRVKRDVLRPYARPVKKGCSAFCWIISAISLIVSLMTMVIVLVSTRKSDLISIEEILKSNYTFILLSDQFPTEFTFSLSTTLDETDLRNLYDSLKPNSCKWQNSLVTKLDKVMLMMTSAELDFDLITRPVNHISYIPGQMWSFPDAAGRFKIGIGLRVLPFLASRYVQVGQVLTGLEGLKELPASNSSVIRVNAC